MMWMSLRPGRSFEEKSGAKHLEKKRRRVEKLMKNLPFSLTKKTTKKNNNNNKNNNNLKQCSAIAQDALL